MGEDDAVLDPTESYPAPSASANPSSVRGDDQTSVDVQIPVTGNSPAYAVTSQATPPTATTFAPPPSGSAAGASAYPKTGHPVITPGPPPPAGQDAANTPQRDSLVQQGPYSQGLRVADNSSRAVTNPTNIAPAYPVPPAGAFLTDKQHAARRQRELLRATRSADGLGSNVCAGQRFPRHRRSQHTNVGRSPQRNAANSQSDSRNDRVGSW